MKFINKSSKSYCQNAPSDSSTEINTCSSKEQNSLRSSQNATQLTIKKDYGGNSIEAPHQSFDHIMIVSANSISDPAL